MHTHIAQVTGVLGCHYVYSSSSGLPSESSLTFRETVHQIQGSTLRSHDVSCESCLDFVELQRDSHLAIFALVTSRQVTLRFCFSHSLFAIISIFTCRLTPLTLSFCKSWLRRRKLSAGNSGKAWDNSKGI